MRSDLSVSVEGVGKEFALGEREQYLALRDVIMSAGARAFGRGKRERIGGHTTWALEDVSFDVRPGEVVGLVGRNGAGKSTLLKLISSITRPTAGTLSVRGRVGTLLEVGSGFHPELTGTENIYLNGAILGMRRSEIDRSFDDIVEFSGVSSHLDTPVKRYSTGMFMRLAFAVAAHLDTEILLVDEVLAVGDAEFQRKCIGRMGELSRNEGRTVLFVSHSDAAIRQLCPRSVWLSDGVVRLDGPSDGVLAAYLDEQFEQTQLGSWIDVPDRARRGSGEARIVQACLDVPDAPDARIAFTGEALRIRLRIEATEAVVCGSVAIQLSTLGGLRLIDAGVRPPDPSVELPTGESEVEILIESLQLNPGRYSCSLWMARPTGSDRNFAAYDIVEHAFDLIVGDADADGASESIIPTRSTFRGGSRSLS